jgi:NAD(P)-dependent dehydrogenase (short-subunit alcohol dehydrogenase family)
MSTRKAIFITGGGSGIGRAIALKFAAEGWFVGVGDIDQKGMDETLALIGNGFTFAYKLDVRDRAAWDQALDLFATAAGGRIDVLVNNAGIAPAGEIGNVSADEISLCIDVNLKGVLFGAQAVHPYLAKTAPGSCLLNIASVAGVYGVGGVSVYCATKAGVRSVTESLDGEWAAEGIKVTDLCPIFVDTPLLDKAPNRGSNELIRQTVVEQQSEVLPVESVAQAAWDAVHSDKLHHLVGKSPRQLGFALRWMPGKVRKQMRSGVSPLGR